MTGSIQTGHLLMREPCVIAWSFYKIYSLFLTVPPFRKLTFKEIQPFIPDISGLIPHQPVSMWETIA